MCNNFKTTSGLIFLIIISAQWANPTATLAEAKKPEHGQVRKTSANFVEVEIVLNDKFSTTDIESLPQGPGNTVKVVGNGKSIRTQLPASQVEAFINQGVDITVLRKFVLIESSVHEADSLYGETGELQTLAINNLYGESSTNVNIPDDNSGWAYSVISSIAGAPIAATVTSVDVHYEISHDYVGDLIVELSDEDYSTYTYLLWQDPYDSGSYIDETETGITAFNGKPVNQLWVLWALDTFPFYGEGYIDYWWIKVYYEGTTGYCPASGGCDEYISGVEVADINNIGTGCEGYADYTAMSTEMEIGTGYPITVTNGNPYPEDECGIWIDWNQDEDFDDANEAIAVTGNPGYGPYTAAITPPADANLGDTRMRVRIVYNQIPAPCGNTSYGEVEDYTITVMPGIPPTVTISGYVKTDTTVAIEGVLMSAGTGESDTTDANGYYDLTFSTPWDGSITPSKDCLSFDPNSRVYSALVSDVNDANFTGTNTCFYGGGSGDANDPYLIYTAEQMNEIGTHPSNWDKHFKLMNNIDLGIYTGTQFNIIGPNAITPFTGTFDGNNKQILNYTYNAITEFPSVIAIFSVVDDPNAEIKNVTLTEPNVIGLIPAVLVTSLASGTMTNCNIEGGTVTGPGSNMIGGLVFGNTDGTIENCTVSSLTISGTGIAGSIAGINKGNISGCHASGSINAGSVGMLVGNNDSGTISDCYASGNIFGNNDVGGLVGRNNGGAITNCYSYGSITGVTNVGGLVGYDNGGSYTKCFWDSDVNPDVNGIGNGSDPNVIGESTANMRMGYTFTGAGWDFRNIWEICEGTNYPKLVWQVPLSGDFVCPDGVEAYDLAVFVEQWLLEKLSADVGPDGGDGFVGLSDWAVFAGAWQSISEPQSANWNAKCDIAPAGGDGIVDMDDLTVFVNQWLQFGAYCADIAPEPDGDGVVDMFDFAIIADNWLEGVE